VTDFQFGEGQKFYQSKILSVWEYPIRRSQGDSFTVTKIQSPDWVNIIPFNEEGRVLMIRQFRFGSGKLTWEFPGGNVDVEEEPSQAALRELKEETGWTAQRLVYLGQVNPNPAFLSNTLYCFAGFELRNLGSKDLDENEHTEERFWDWEEVKTKLGTSEFDHGIMLSTAWFYLRWQESQK